MKLVSIVGARPNFVKLAALVWEARDRPEIDLQIVHTGQHYDDRLSGSFFEDLDIPAPDLNLEVGSGPPLAQLRAMLTRLEKVLDELRPDKVLVVGDVTSTLAGALAASRKGIFLAHVEAGLRSFDPSMPEEVNRRLTDSLSNALFATEPAAVENLAREGIDPDRVHLVGNTMIDTLLRFRDQAQESQILERLGLATGGYGVLTLHRPANVDRGSNIEELLEAVAEAAAGLPLIFPVHPRTREALRGATIPDEVHDIEPLPYLDFLRLLADARVVLTDSGGIQEETTVLEVPCLTLREGTERPITVSEGTNRIVGTHPDGVRRALSETLRNPSCPGAVPALWDGKAAGRILDRLLATERIPVP